MTNPTDEELDVAVGNATWLYQYSTSSFTSPYGCHKDWNALMAAVEKLVGNVKGNWFSISQNDGFDSCLYECEIKISGQKFSKCDGHSLARAVALCIYAVVNQ